MATDSVEYLVDLDPMPFGINQQNGRRRKDPPATPLDVRDYLGEMYLFRAMALLQELTAS